MASEGPKRIEFKKFSADDAGKRVGWTDLRPVPESDAFVARGAFGTISERGASIELRECDGERLFSTGMVDGVLRACSWTVTIVPDDERWKGEFPSVHYGDKDYIVNSLAGYGFYDNPDVDSDSVTWAEGDEGLTAAIRTKLEEAGIGDEYPHTYLAINGWVGSHLQYQEERAGLGEVARAQIFDETMVGVADSEHTTARTYAEHLNARMIAMQQAYMQQRRGAYSAGQYLRLREVAHAANKDMEVLAKQMKLLRLVFTPERDLTPLRYNKEDPERSIVDMYASTMKRIETGSADSLADTLESEYKNLRSRYEFANRGATALFALTLKGQQQALSS